MTERKTRHQMEDDLFSTMKTVFGAFTKDECVLCGGSKQIVDENNVVVSCPVCQRVSK